MNLMKNGEEMCSIAQHVMPAELAVACELWHCEIIMARLMHMQSRQGCLLVKGLVYGLSHVCYKEVEMIGLSTAACLWRAANTLGGKKETSVGCEGWYK